MTLDGFETGSLNPPTLRSAARLEVIDKGACTPTHPVPLLFVHGAWHGAWCWDEYFLDFFADNGFRALAVSLRGHGKSPTATPLRRCSCADYVDDVRSVADDLPAAPVVIGHSMGGYVVQKYLEQFTAPAGVLLASMSPRGCLGFLLRLAKQHPWRATRATITGKSAFCFNTPERARKYFFSANTPEPDVVRYAARLQEESQRAAFDGFLLDVPRPQLVTTPLLVLGAEHDSSFTIKEVRATARAYGTDAEIFPDMGHDMMLEPGWSAVAERIQTWLGSRGL
ncbi:alpha/beta hydrolase [Mycobacterium kyorinense]|uniref:Alpha/beta hydrolase n=1 Tax=Mycobacterium kyorinense TaxID=487514 RepID=A0A1A2YU64_9MYCO|nr:alpha/beta fold hydrolase [Mycobacterium kyorinense]OBI41545.1 alpha/beta hydrolase [Mycobacterium kyorinense]